MGFFGIFRTMAGNKRQPSPQDAGSCQIRMVVGLGNPGAEYQGTRHNVGFDVVDRLSAFLGATISKKKFGALTGEAGHAGKKLILLKPQEYMNLSGQAVSTAAGFFKISPEQVLVITDDMALPPGRIRIRPSGGAGGHNGLADIMQKLGTDNFPRLRVGIGKVHGAIARNYVLGRPSAEDRELFEVASRKAVEAALCWVETGVTAAMNRFNVADEPG